MKPSFQENSLTRNLNESGSAVIYANRIGGGSYLHTVMSSANAAICLILVLIVLCGAGLAQQLPVKMQLLVISATDKDPGYQAITSFLDYQGVPYECLIATQLKAANQKLTPSMLMDGSVGKYQGIILVTDGLAILQEGTYVSAFDAAEWQALSDYEIAYKIRQVTYFTYPSDKYGLSVPTVSAADFFIHLTAEGQKVFPYLKADARIPVRLAYSYLARPIDATTISLLEDDAKNAILSVHTYPNGIENLTVTCDNWYPLLHSQLLSFGIIDWVTRGIHLGERTVYLTPQVDDIFLDNDLFDPNLKAVNPNRLYRITSKDMQAVENWQNSVRSLRNPSFEQFTITMVFNGNGAQGTTDTLEQYFKERQDRYNWINHTYNHLNLNTVDYANALMEFQLNHQFAQIFPLLRYRVESLVTGAISGLTNPEAMRAMADFGIKYIVSDSSRVGQNNPQPNIGIENALQPSVLEIPRRPTNIYTTASTKAEEVGQYNAIYRSYWGKDLLYPEIIDLESNQLLSYMLSYDMDPLMFHQSNLRAYNGVNSLLGDLMDAAIRKYSQYMNLPVLSPNQDALGARMAQRMARRQAGVTAQLVPGSGTIQLTGAKSAVVPITGIAVGKLAGIDTYSAGTYRDYGGKLTSWIQIQAGQSLSVPLTGGQTGTLPPNPPTPPTTSLTFYPTVATVNVGSYDWGGINSFKILDNDTYDVRSVLSNGSQVIEWEAATQISGSLALIKNLMVTYKGCYSVAGISQEVFMAVYDGNQAPTGWESLGKLTVGNVDDVTVSKLIDINPQRYISSNGEVRIKVKGVGSSSFYCWANFLSWAITRNTSSATNIPPVARDDTFTTGKDQPLVITSAMVLANDTDADRDALSITLLDKTATKGTIVETSTGMYTYYPPSGFTGTDSFLYFINDGRGGTVSAQVVINVLASSVPPATYYPTAVSFTTGSLDYGEMAGFKAVDNNTYDVRSGTVTSGSSQIAEWEATTKISGSPTLVKKLTMTYAGQYSVAGITQEVYAAVYNGQSALSSWELIDKRTVGNSDDVTISKLIDININNGNPQRYISSAGEMRLKVKGIGTSTSFYCWANLLSWQVQ